MPDMTVIHDSNKNQTASFQNSIEIGIQFLKPKKAFIILVLEAL
jgi:hypothetical protein